jgi:hypothetical protein
MDRCFRVLIGAAESLTVSARSRAKISATPPDNDPLAAYRDKKTKLGAARFLA